MKRPRILDGLLLDRWALFLPIWGNIPVLAYRPIFVA
jgi:hypothetical protein